MGLYISTSKRACKSAKELCRMISALPESVCENRGGKSIEGVVARARVLGKNRVLLVSEKKGKPAALSFISVKARDWEWLPGEIAIWGFKGTCEEKSADGIEFSGEMKEIVKELIGADEPDSDDVVKVVAGKKEIKLVKGKKVFLSMRVEKYEGFDRS